MTPSALTAPLSPATYATERTPLHDELFVRATIADAFADLRDTWEPAATKAATWADYEWPAWVPEKVREQIEGFWSESWGRGPAAWEFSAKQNGAPAMGEVVTLRDGFFAVSEPREGQDSHPLEEYRDAGWFIAKIHGDRCPKCVAEAGGIRSITTEPYTFWAERRTS